MITEQELNRELREIVLPDAPAAEHRMIQRLRVEMAAVIPPAAHAQTQTRPATGRLSLLQRPRLAIVAVLGLVLALSPWGQAAAEWVGDRVGEIGGSPTVEQHPDQGRAAAVVIATGTAPNGDAIELAAYQSEAKGTCFALDWPGRDPSLQNGGALCLDDWDASKTLEFSSGATASEGAFGRDGELVVYGFTAPEVTDVVVNYGGTEATTVFGAVDQELQDRAGLSQRVGFFVALMPPEVLPQVAASAYDSGDQLLAHRSFPQQYLDELAPPFVSLSYAAAHTGEQEAAHQQMLERACAAATPEQRARLAQQGNCPAPPSDG